jgi:NAD(P)-dependent dehydrogenase (short-subunit alcohol dehydrogenase family)
VMRGWESSVTVVTGGAGHLGSAVATKLADLGAHVMVVDQDLASLGALGRPGLATFAGDVSRRETAFSAVTESVARWGGLDVIVNCAGIDLPSARDALTTSADDWRRTFAVNLDAIVWFVQAGIPEMRLRGAGSIVNVASSSGLAPGPANSAYSVSKAAVISLTRSLAIDHAADGIRVNCVCPSLLPLPMADLERTLDPAALRARVDRGRAATPGGELPGYGEVAATIAFLAGPEASGITGATVTVDHGFSAGQRVRYVE